MTELDKYVEDLQIKLEKLKEANNYINDNFVPLIKENSDIIFDTSLLGNFQNKPQIMITIRRGDIWNERGHLTPLKSKLELKYCFGAKNKSPYIKVISVDGNANTCGWGKPGYDKVCKTNRVFKDYSITDMDFINKLVQMMIEDKFNIDTIFLMAQEYMKKQEIKKDFKKCRNCK